MTAPNGLFLLPEAGVGYVRNAGAGKSGVGYHAGLSVMLPASADAYTRKYYGVYAGYMTLYASESVKSEPYLSVGIALTMEIRQRFRATIGTIGYVGLSDNALNNPFGLTTRSQYRPFQNVPVYVGLRSDWLFAKQQLTGYNGLNLSVIF